MPHFAITGLLKRVFQKAVKDNNKNLLPSIDINQSRRKFLQDTAILGSGMLFTPSLLKATNFKTISAIKMNWYS